MTTAIQDEARVTEPENELRLTREQHASQLTAIRDELREGRTAHALIRVNAYLAEAGAPQV